MRERVNSTLDGFYFQLTLSFSAVDIFGRPREVDFSLFTPRGHYVKKPTLSRYFQSMMWCGTIDLRIAGPKAEVSTRELGSACVLHHLLSSSPQLMTMWIDFDRVLQTFIGITDSMTFSQLGTVLTNAKKKIDRQFHPSKLSFPLSFRDYNLPKTEEELVALQDFILESDVGQQNISSQLVLPRSFTVMGQKFTIDSWITSNTVCANGVFDCSFRSCFVFFSVTELFLQNGLSRRIPTALDVAYSVFGNSHAAAELTRMMNDKNGVPFRDGYVSFLS